MTRSLIHLNNVYVNIYVKLWNIVYASLKINISCRYCYIGFAELETFIWTCSCRGEEYCWMDTVQATSSCFPRKSSTWWNFSDYARRLVFNIFKGETHEDLKCKHVLNKFLYIYSPKPTGWRWSNPQSNRYWHIFSNGFHAWIKKHQSLSNCYCEISTYIQGMSI